MVCLEPNPDFYRLAQACLGSYPRVQLLNCSFEEWELVPQGFAAVVAASSLHWIRPEIAYSKAAAALARPHGQLIMLWNKELQPPPDLYQELARILPRYDLPPRPYEDPTAQLAILDQLGQRAISSGYFRDLVLGHQEVVVIYSLDRYLNLMSTYSPYERLPGLQWEKLRTDWR